LQRAKSELETAKSHSGSATSFIQTKEHLAKIDNLKDRLSYQLNKMSETQVVVVEPIINGFLQVTAETQNVESIQKAIEAIDNLITHFGKGLETLDSSYQAEKQALETKIAHHKSILEDLAENKIPAKNAELDDNEAAQSAK